MKLGIAPINWTNDDDPALGGHIPFEQCIDEMARSGFTGTELGSKFPRDIPVLKAALASRGLSLASAWFGSCFTEPGRFEESCSRFLEHLSFLHAVGARAINICECGHAIQHTGLPFLGAQKPVFTEKQWALLVNGLHTAGRLAHDWGMTLVYHYHAGTGVFTEAEIDYLMAHTSPALVSLLLDTGHAALAGIRPDTLVARYGKRIRHVHLKDIREPVLARVQAEGWSFMDSVRAGVFTVPGDGSIDFSGILTGLHEAEYQGWYIVEAEQDPAKAPPTEYARKARDYIQTLTEEYA